jgi:4-hydroxy-2-oxoheptanedioate aldolase
VPNTVLDLLESGNSVVNGWLAIPSGFSAEIMAQGGFDSITVDLQHGVQDYQSMIQCFQAMRGYPVVPMARVPSNEPGIIGKVVDGGAMGVICPMINTSEEAERFVAAVKYPPMGSRSNGPIRAAMGLAPGSYQATANRDTLCIPMIETKAAVENLDNILDVDGVAGVYIGPADLGFSYGLAPMVDRAEPEMLAIYDRVIEACGRRGLFAGLHCGGGKQAALAIERGFRFVTPSSDSGLLSRIVQAEIASARNRAVTTVRSQAY